MTDRELEELIVWFEHLLEKHLEGDHATVEKSIRGAIKTLKRDKESR